MKAVARTLPDESRREVRLTVRSAQQQSQAESSARHGGALIAKA